MQQTLTNRISNVITATLISDSQDENDNPPLKRLRLTHQDDQIDLASNLINKLKETTDSNTSELIDLILKFCNDYDRKWIDLNENELNDEEVLRFLLEKYQSFVKDTSKHTLKLSATKVRASKSINNQITVEILLLKCIYKVIKPQTLAKHAFELMLLLNQTSVNHKLLYELFKIIEQSIDLVQESLKFKEILLPYLKKSLKSNDHRLRKICLRLFSLNYINYDETLNDAKVIQILFNHLEDQDARVRVCSLKLLIILHERGHNVDFRYYEVLKHLLSDDHDQVRLLTLQMLCLQARTYPEHSIDIGNGLEVEEIRLIDEVFVRICNMINNDLSLEVKQEAARLLGKLKSISPKFLLQTLDKKLMKDLKKKSINTQKTLLSTEWSTIVDNSDSTINDDESLSLMSSGACGAFIHGLEDELLEVRHESVLAIMNLAVDCPEFAAKSIDFLVDMFNDEIESVRLAAIQALAKISHYVLLNDDQVDIVLPVLEDGSFEVREALRDLLGNCKLATRNALKKCTQFLFNNYKKYQIDLKSIWKCCQFLGRNHAKFVLPLVTYYLNLHPYFDMPEADMDDPIYIASLILIFNAAKQNSTLVSLMPKYVYDHYFYLKSKQPELIPCLELLDDDCYSNDLFKFKPNDDTDVNGFYSNLVDQLKMSASLGNDSQTRLYESIAQDLNHLAQIEPSIMASSESISLFLKCLLILKKQNNNDCSLDKIEEALATSVRLITCYHGFKREEICVIMQLINFLRASFLKQLSLVKKNTNSLDLASYLRRDLSKECRDYLNFLKKYQNFLQNVPPNLEMYEQNPLALMDFINSTCVNVDLLIIAEPKRLTKQYIELLEPIDNFETPIRFTPGLLCSVKLKAFFYNFKNFTNLYIQIKYSDYEIHYVQIDALKVRNMSETKHLLDTEMQLSLSNWTESSYLRFSLAMYTNDDYKLVPIDQENMEIDSKNMESEAQLIKINDNFIELTKCVKIYFEPNAKKH